MAQTLVALFFLLLASCSFCTVENSSAMTSHPKKKKVISFKKSCSIFRNCSHFFLISLQCIVDIIHKILLVRCFYRLTLDVKESEVGVPNGVQHSEITPTW